MPSDADLAVARAATSEMLGKGGKTANMPWDDPRTGARGTITPIASAYTHDGGKRPADLAFLGRFAREMVCPLTGKLRGRHDDGYGSSRS